MKVRNPCFMTKWNINAQSSPNPIASTSSRIYFSYLLIVITAGWGDMWEGRWEGGRGKSLKSRPSFCSSFQISSQCGSITLRLPPSPKHRFTVVAYFLEVFAWREADETEKRALKVKLTDAFHHNLMQIHTKISSSARSTTVGALNDKRWNAP